MEEVANYVKTNVKNSFRQALRKEHEICGMTGIFLNVLGSFLGWNIRQDYEP